MDGGITKCSEECQESLDCLLTALTDVRSKRPESHQGMLVIAFNRGLEAKEEQ